MKSSSNPEQEEVFSKSNKREVEYAENGACKPRDLI
jgi:hypothetical protein